MAMIREYWDSYVVHPPGIVCISLFIFKYKNNVYCANAPIISKTVGIWKGIVLTGLEVI